MNATSCPLSYPMVCYAKGSFPYAETEFTVADVSPL